MCIVFALPSIALASGYIGITATGSGAPLPPINFTATVSDTDEVSNAWIKATLTWDMPAGADTVTVVRRLDRFATSILDGDLIYEDNGVAYDDTITGEDIENVYYSAWAENSYGYSEQVNYKLEVKPKMVNATLLLGAIFLSLCLSGMGYYFKKVPIVVTACLLWLGTGAWAFTQRVDPYDIYFFIGCVGIIMGLISAFEPWVWMVREETKTLSESEREAELDQRLHKEYEDGDKQHKRRRRLP